MKILMIADPHIPVPPSHYGGAERIVALYAEEFSRLGHRVDLMAGPGSKAFGGKLYLHQAPSKAYLSRAHRKIRFQLQSILAATECDIVYNHGRFDYMEALLAANKPLMHCFHNGIDGEQIRFAEQRMRSCAAFHFLSESQRSAARVQAPNVLFKNFVDTASISLGYGGGGYLCFLGRLTRNKGVDVAIAVAKKMHRKLLIAGNVSSEEGGEEFFREQVEPHIDGDQIRWVGPVNDFQKSEILGAADALLFPIRWQDPCPLVLMESLACGCPVVATRRASTPEIIDDGVTGWLCEPEEPSVEAFMDAVSRLHELDRQACRQAAEHRFDVRVVAPRVLDVLQKLAQRQAIA